MALKDTVKHLRELLANITQDLEKAITAIKLLLSVFVLEQYV